MSTSSSRRGAADDRLREIIAQARGDRAEAERLLKIAIDRDPVFLRGLVEPFLPGIIAHALSRITPQPASPVQGTPAPLGGAGMDSLLRAMAGRIGGEPHSSAEPERQAPAASADRNAHADVIRGIAAAQARRRKD